MVTRSRSGASSPERSRRGFVHARSPPSVPLKTVFEPATMRSKALEAGAQGKTWFQWGYRFDPSPGDPRNIQFRVHVKDGQPSEIEMFVQLRQCDGSPNGAQSVKFLWPGA